MSTPLDQLYNAKKQAQVLALQKQRDAALQGYNGQLQDTTSQFNQQLPTYQTERNAADANAFRTQQGILERAAALGNYRAGSTNTAMVNTANQANQNIADITGAENRFRDTYNNNVTKLRNAMTTANNDYNNGVSSIEQQIAAELAQAKQQEAQQAAATQARVARASAPKPLSRTAQNQANTDQAMAEIKSLYDSRVSYDDALKQYQAVKAQMQADGVSTSAIEKYMQALWANANSTPTSMGNFRMAEQQIASQPYPTEAYNKAMRGNSWW